MLVNILHIDADTILAHWQLSESAEEMWALLQNQEAYRSHYEQMKSEKRKQEWLASKLIVEQVCGPQVQVVYDVNGIPSLKDHSQNISITHSGKDVYVLFHTSRMVGIDVERMTERVLNVKEKFMNAQELALHQSVREITLLWCAKEAAYKCTSVQDPDFTHMMVAEKLPNEDMGTFQLHQNGQQITMYYEQKADYAVVWCIV